MSAANATSDEQIYDACEAAILAIVEGRGSSWTIAGRQFTTLDLDKLRALAKEYRARISRKQTGMFQRVRFRDA